MKTKPNENAFPDALSVLGLTKLEYMATHLMAGFAANGMQDSVEHYAPLALRGARALIAELNKGAK